MVATGATQQFLRTAVDALEGAGDWRALLDDIPVPIYTTDAAGAVTYWNSICAELVGREPQMGEDRWCVTWKLYTVSGEPLAHDECPMARAIHEKRPVHDEIIIVERPDGDRLACRPYPTPYFNRDGELDGAINLIIEVTHEQAAELTEQAERCRRLARATTDPRAAAILAEMAKGYAQTAEKLRASE